MSVVAEPLSEPESEPAWDIARLFPNQGTWSEDDYLSLNTKRLVELNDGYVEVLPYPTVSHQLILGELLHSLSDFVESNSLGQVIMAPFPLRLRPNKFRAPDVMFLGRRRRRLINEYYFDGADLVIEVVNPNDPDRDLILKRAEYADAGIAEYWIADLRSEHITVLTLQDHEYVEHGDFMPSEVATSVLLPGFDVDVAAVFASTDILRRGSKESRRRGTKS